MLYCLRNDFKEKVCICLLERHIVFGFGVFFVVFLGFFWFWFFCFFFFATEMNKVTNVISETIGERQTRDLCYTKWKENSTKAISKQNQGDQLNFLFQLVVRLLQSVRIVSSCSLSCRPGSYT